VKTVCWSVGYRYRTGTRYLHITGMILYACYQESPYPGAELFPVRVKHLSIHLFTAPSETFFQNGPTYEYHTAYNSSLNFRYSTGTGTCTIHARQAAHNWIAFLGFNLRLVDCLTGSSQRQTSPARRHGALSSKVPYPRGLL